ncbi:MAG: hypothetical protein E7188_05100 [Erysipelotrichaceae bacterium]|nr:hypothetical protein [Erysipelotrichaceae bacterium]
MKAQVFLTPAAGKKLIARAVCRLPEVVSAMKDHTIVIIKGTGNAYIAEELLHQIHEPFTGKGFYRGISVPPGTELSPLQKEDLVIRKGRRIHGMTVFDAVDSLGPGDVLVKGANAVHLASRTCGVLIGNPTGGTMNAVRQAKAQGAEVLFAVGVEKRVDVPTDQLAVRNEGAAGLRFFPGDGEIITELDAFSQLYGLQAEILAAGGVAGAEGGACFLLEGEEEALARCFKDLEDIRNVPLYEV